MPMYKAGIPAMKSSRHCIRCKMFIFITMYNNYIYKLIYWLDFYEVHYCQVKVHIYLASELGTGDFARQPSSLLERF